MIHRLLATKLKYLAGKLPAVVITGPRQSGKTTLAKLTFPKKPYISFEDPSARDFATQDPKSFLQSYPRGAIFDEIQRVPHLFSYLQSVIDDKNKPGLFILTGSQQFLMIQNLSQTLAGRVGILHLLPFSLQELKTLAAKSSLEEILFKGLYPRIFQLKIHPTDWYPSYIQTYIERDVRLIKNISNLTSFHKFLKMCAARSGQILNLSSLANDCGITHVTARDWISILEASYIVYLLKPFHRNLNKRLIKSPKLYFYDTGVLCSLLDIQDKKELLSHALRGAIFETLIVGEFLKARYNAGLPLNIYFWRDKTGHEIDCILQKKGVDVPIEIKSGRTIASDWFKNIQSWKHDTAEKTRPVLVYGGDEDQKRSDFLVTNWRRAGFLNT